MAMVDRLAERGPAKQVDKGGVSVLSAPSSLMSSRWSRDNVVTPDPALLYDGRIEEWIGADTLEAIISDLISSRGQSHVGACRLGVFTWDISCGGARGPFILQVPLVLDEQGAHHRSKRDVPRLNVEHARYFIGRGLSRFVLEPEELLVLRGDVPAAIFQALPYHHPITFGGGHLRVELYEGERSWAIPLGPTAAGDLLAEMIAALVYHYEPEEAGGTCVADVFVNDGDFVVRRRKDGSFDVRLMAIRQRQAGVTPNLLLLYLIQMMAYEDFSVGDGLIGLPLLVSNPSVVFEGTVRGLRYRYQDGGRAAEEGFKEARRWIFAFGRSREGRAYRPWVDRFLAGELTPAFGTDPRDRWWRLTHLQQKHTVFDLCSRHASMDPAPARALKTLLDRLLRESCRAVEEPPGLRINDLGREALLAVLEEARMPLKLRDAVAGELLARWPYRSLEQLSAEVPAAAELGALRSRLSFGHVVADEDEGTLKGLASAPKRALYPVANPELFGGLVILDGRVEAALATFPTFEAYMDSALHDPTWGYYSKNVVIGAEGHFSTHPENLSPHYGKWVAMWAFEAFRDMVAAGELSEADPFSVVEFGAGNGRLARDFLDAVAAMAAHPDAPSPWRVFAGRVRYRIYEVSASLRDKQRELLGDDAVISLGDARSPAETLQRDFPEGIKGLVISNEVPDAFGVHKVVLTGEGQVLVALVIPRVEPVLKEALGGALSRRIGEADRTVRQTFGFDGFPEDSYLDAETYWAVMKAVSGLPEAERSSLLGALWLEEAYVPASAVEELAAHLRANRSQYAMALAAEDSGVVLYVNVHAGRFIRELGASLTAGFIITIDYGDTTWGLVQGARRGDFPFRIYRDDEPYVPKPNDPYAAPGHQDLTADVNFTDLARAGKDAGLSVVHFGPERDLIGPDFPELLALAEREDVAAFLGNPVFKVLVLGTRPSGFFSGPFMSPQPLFRTEQDLPKSRRKSLRTLQQRLEMSGGAPRTG